MKKKTTKDYQANEKENTINEPHVGYYIPMQPPLQKESHREPILKDFLYKDFKHVANKAPFTLAEWADMLHISERTLQRYAKENQEFNGLQIEIILLIEKMVDMGNDLFGKNEFKEWLHSSVFSISNKQPKDYLNSFSGIQEIINIIGRIQHGIPS